MNGGTTIALAGLGSAFVAGMFFGVAILIGKLPRKISNILEWRRLRALRMSDDWDHQTPWRDM